MKNVLRIFLLLTWHVTTFAQNFPVQISTSGFPVKIANPEAISQQNFTTAFRNKLAAIELRNQEIPVVIPSGMTVDSVEYPFKFSIVEQKNGINTAKVSLTPEAIFNTYSTALSSPGAVFYVSQNGNNTNDGLTVNTPFRSIYKAIQSANTANVPTKIFVSGGLYSRQSGFSFNFSVTPTVDIAVIATGGRVQTGAFEDYTAPTVDATYLNCYSFTRSGVDRVLDMYAYDEFGNYKDFVKVNTASECNSTPDSWAIISNSTVYINRKDRKPVTSVNSRVLLSGTTGILLSANNSMFLGGLTEADGIDLYGGGATGTVIGRFSTIPTAKKAFIAKNCSFSYGGGYSQTTARGIDVDGLHGLIFLQNCDASANATDGFNFHNTINIGVAKSFAVTVNCTGSNNGGLMVNSSCNGWTTHEDLIGMDICGYYQGNHGGTVRSVNATKNYFAGTVVKNDLGDIQGGGFIRPTAFRSDDDSIYWLDRCIIDMPARTSGLVTSGNGKIYIKNMPPSRLANVGNILSY